MAYFQYRDPVSGLVKDCYIDNRFKRNLEKTKRKLRKKDTDFNCALDGSEGSGKSVLGIQICSFIDPTFNLSRICFNGAEFQNAVLKARQFEAILFDESFMGMSSRSVLTKENKRLISLMQTIRQKNLFIIIVNPSIFMMDRYMSMHRTQALFHVWVGKNNKHMFFVFNRRMKMKLLLEGKKTMEYGMTIKKNKGIIYCCAFTNCYANINEEEYRAKKLKAFLDFGKVDTIDDEDDAMNQRNIIIYHVLHKEYELSSYKIADLLTKHGFKITRSGIRDIIIKVKKGVKSNEMQKM